MERIYQIQNHPLFKEQYGLITQAEEKRVFCRHTMEHFLDVARLMYIYDLEDGAGIDKEIIYAAALLHDIGRFEQISRGTPHDVAGARIAGQIMSECGFSEEEIHTVQEAIASHRTEETSKERSHNLKDYLYRADKKSRNCFLCPAYAECNWSEEKKNMRIDC